jgi:hypothetical protein
MTANMMMSHGSSPRIRVTLDVAGAMAGSVSVLMVFPRRTRKGAPAGGAPFLLQI